MSLPRVHRLSGGLTVICDPVPGFETLALSVVAGRGARAEDPGRAGWSHLLEHMVFKGAGERSALELVEAIESEGGQINAATGYERTSFQVRALQGGLPLAMEVTADLVLRPTLDAEDLEREKGVIGQEIAEAADTPDDHVFELAQSAAFPDQPLGRSILGTTESLAGADPISLGAWRGALYGHDRLVVSASGAIDEDQLLHLAERHFPASPTTAPAPELADADFVGGVMRERRRLEQAHLVFLLPTVGVSDPAYWAVRLFSEILGGGMSSRLFQEAREKRGLAYAIDSYAETYKDIGVVGVYAGCEAANAGQLATVVGEQVRGMADKVSDVELARAKAQLKGALFMARESLSSRAEQAAAQYLALGRLLSTAEIAAGIDAVTSRDVAALGERLLAPRRAVAGVLAGRGAQSAPERFLKAVFA